MDSVCATITRAIKNKDRFLYAERDVSSGVVHIMRKMGNVSDYVFSLTDTWGMNGEPRNWGIDPILNRLRATDLWENPDFFDEFLKEKDREADSEERSRTNSIEDFIHENYSNFKKQFNDINTANMDKTRDIRRKIDRRVNNGNC